MKEAILAYSSWLANVVDHNPYVHSALVLAIPVVLGWLIWEECGKEHKEVIRWKK